MRTLAKVGHAALAGNRTRVNCLEGSYAHHYTTNAAQRSFSFHFFNRGKKFTVLYLFSVHLKVGPVRIRRQPGRKHFLRFSPCSLPDVLKSRIRKRTAPAGSSQSPPVPSSVRRLRTTGGEENWPVIAPLRPDTDPRKGNRKGPRIDG